MTRVPEPQPFQPDPGTNRPAEYGSEHDLRALRAGHPLPLHIDRRNAVRPVDIEGSFIGVTTEPLPLPTCCLRLEPGESLLLYTDGITEARNGDHEQLGEERLAQALSRELAETPTAQQVIDVVTAVVGAFAGGTDLLGDDQAALVLTAGREEQG